MINVGLGSLPLAGEMLARGGATRPLNSVTDYVPEISFVAIMTGVAAIQDAFRVPSRHKLSNFFTIIGFGIAILLFVQTLHMGMYFWETIRGPATSAELHSSLTSSQIIATISLVLSFIAEGIFLAKVKKP